LYRFERGRAGSFTPLDTLRTMLDIWIADDKTLLLQIFSNLPPSWMPSTELKDFEGVTLDSDGFVTKVNLRVPSILQSFLRD